MNAIKVPCTTKLLAAVSSFLLTIIFVFFGEAFAIRDPTICLAATAIGTLILINSMLHGMVFGRRLVKITTSAAAFALLVQWLPLTIYATFDFLGRSALALLALTATALVGACTGALIRAKIAMRWPHLARFRP